MAITKGFLCTKKMFKNKSAMKLWILYLFFPSWRFANSLRFWKNNQNPQFFGFEKLKKIRINEYYQNQITQPNYRFFTSYSFMKIPNSWRFSKTTRTHNSLVLKHWKKSDSTNIIKIKLPTQHYSLLLILSWKSPNSWRFFKNNNKKNRLVLLFWNIEKN